MFWSLLFGSFIDRRLFTFIIPYYVSSMYFITLIFFNEPDWAARDCPLHCPDPSLLKAASRLSSQWPGRGGGGCPGWRESCPCSTWARQGIALKHTYVSCIAH
jgi:hypothetical protein